MTPPAPAHSDLPAPFAGAPPSVCPVAPGADGRLGVVVEGEVHRAGLIEGVGPLVEGRRALVVFDGGDPARPVVVGLLAAPIEGLVDLGAAESPAPAVPAESARPSPLSVWADGREVRLEARDRIELRCGEASLTLRHDGKVEIRGTHVLSRSSGPNRIKGGSVSIN